jgi:Tfp pilus assembly protein PilO
MKRKIKEGDAIKEIEFLDEEPLAEEMASLREAQLQTQASLKELSELLKQKPSQTSIESVVDSVEEEQSDTTLADALEGKGIINE